MRILHISSEAVPYAKTGGLADVAASLCSYLATAGHDVTLVLPLYRAVREAGFETGDALTSLELSGGRPIDIRAMWLPSGVRVLFVDAPELFDRDGLYGSGGADHPDNARRFAAFTRAALEASARLAIHPHVVHCHDWQTALAPLYLSDPSFADTTGGRQAVTVLTLHNLAYQGVFEAADTADAGLPAGPAARTLRADGHVSFLRGGILCADRVTTVSPRYAREIATPVFGFGLESVISALDPPVLGILNGLDVEKWDPATDPVLPATYRAADMTGKVECKKALQTELGLPPQPGTPLFAMVSRMVEQKGLGLLAQLGHELPNRQAQFVFLGTGEKRFEQFVADLDSNHPNVATRLIFSEALAHRIEAGADFFLMPSAFEPCGLSQMISQRYGTPPIVHEVGGLADSVTDATPAALVSGEATGIAFKSFEAGALESAIERALALYRDPPALVRLRRAGMERDFSWRASGREYETLYRQTLDATPGER